MRGFRPSLDLYQGEAHHVGDNFKRLKEGLMKEANMKLAIALSLALLTTGFVALSSQEANAVVYCQYISYPAGCVARPGVVLRPRPVARAVRGTVTQGTAINRGGPVNRIGRR